MSHTCIIYTTGELPHFVLTCENLKSVMKVLQVNFPFWFQIVNSLKQKLHAVERTVKDKEAELR